MNPTRMRLSTALPLDLASDPDFALASLLAVDARIAADRRFGPGATMEIRAVRVSIEVTIPDQAPPELAYVETEWDVIPAREVIVTATSLFAGRA